MRQGAGGADAREETWERRARIGAGTLVVAAHLGLAVGLSVLMQPTWSEPDGLDVVFVRDPAPAPEEATVTQVVVVPERAEAPAPSPPIAAPAARAPDATPPVERRPAPAGEDTAAPAVERDDAPAPPDFSFMGEDGRLRVGRDLADRLDAEAAAQAAAEEAANPGFRYPAGDAHVLAERPPVLEPDPTIFSEDWVPDDMTAEEMACWNSRTLRVIAGILGNADCANAGGRRPRPQPEPIRYGEDSPEDVARKHREWEEYARRR